MEGETKVMNSSDRPQTLSAEQATRILASLEPASIARAFQTVCAELLGPCETGVFTFLPDDQTRVLRFGEEEGAKPTPAPVLGTNASWGSAAPVGGGSSPDRWRAHIALGDPKDDGLVGILEISLEKPPEEHSIEVLKTLERTLTVAVRNGQTFEKTTRLTFTDDLTALYNSRFMALYLEREVRRCRRMRSPLSLLFMDLDGFKNINDTHGHLAGSKTLVEVGAVLEKTVRDADVLIRYGGDEFVILFPETPLFGGLVIAERIRRVIESTKFLESQQIDARISASIGIAAYPESAEDVRGLISSADRAMYEAKALGKNRVVAARPLSPSESLKRP